MIKLMLIGCGAVSEILYRPAFEHVSREGLGQLVAVVDRDLPRAREYADYFHAEAFDSLDEVLSTRELDAAVIAVPHVLHAPVTIQCLNAGLGVLCEKPMAVNTAKCDQMIETARSTGRPLVIGLFRRYFPSTQAIKAILDEQLLGPAQGFEFLEGQKYSWPLRTASLVSRRLSGGGVLIDAGAHLLDLLLWWLGDVATVDYADDAMGGVEANCELKLRMESGVSGRVRLSREQPLPNSYTIHCQQGDIIYKCDDVYSVFIRDGATQGIKEIDLRQKSELEKYKLSFQQPRFEFRHCFFAQLEDFCRVVTGAGNPLVSLGEAKKVVELVQRCYQSRRFLRMPWLSDAEQIKAEVLAFQSENRGGGVDTSSSNKPAVAIVGAGGFIGYRLCEWLILHDYAVVTPVVRSAKSLALLARFDLQPEFADVLDQQSLERAFTGKDIVFHTVVGDRKTIVEGIGNTIRAAKSAGVKRLVYLSTACVYGNTPTTKVDEETPHLKNQPFAYNNAKVEAEEVIGKLREELSIDVVVLRPFIVWGPRSQSWVINVAQSLKEGCAYLVDGGIGICNTVYIDNLVEALWLAATVSEAKNQDFIINDADMVTWHDLYSGLARELDIKGCPWQVMSLKDAEKGLVRLVRQARLRRWKNLPFRIGGKVLPQSWKPLARRMLQLPGIYPQSGNVKVSKGPILDGEIVSLQLGSCRLSGTKASQVLGYEPPVSFAEGMTRTGRWLRFVEAWPEGESG